MNEVRCPYCGTRLAKNLTGSIELFCRRCKRVVLIKAAA